MALDSTPGDLSPAADPGSTNGESPHWSDRRVLVVAITIGGLILVLLNTGVVDAAGHALAHAFPGLMDGCGGG